MMHSLLRLTLVLASLAAPSTAVVAQENAPLRVYLRGGPPTHGEGEHEHEQFVADWAALLGGRGVAISGSLAFPGAADLEATDVLVMYAAEGASIHGEERERFVAYLGRGGGLVVLHDAVCGDDPTWFQTKAGGAWEHGHSKWLEGEIGLTFTDLDHPITRGVANFDFVDEIYYDLHMAENAQVLATSFHSVFSITPQMWVVDDGPYRAFVSLQGHEHTSFSHPAWRTLLLRAIAWAGHRDVDLLTTPDEVQALRYPPGGPLAPDVAHAPFALHDDFELELVAVEPLVINPISIDWDDRGRMWVALTPSYPYKEKFSGDPPRDSIVILSDADGDGRMDHSHTFADGLDLATSFVFHGDGVIVSTAPYLLFLRDTDGDDVADTREALFEGFGYGDTHAVISNLRHGLDGWIYATQGYSGNESRDIRNAHGEAFGNIPNGLFRFRPDGSAIEPVSVYGSNTWGLDFDWSGELFFTMANGSHLRHVVASEQALGPQSIKGTRSWNDIVDHREIHRISRSDREPYLQIDYVGGFTAAAGCLIYSGGAWPAEFASDHFVCEPTVNLVHRDNVQPAGATFAATKPRTEEFLASTDPWFRPVHLRTGPDGAMYVLDFYNQAIVHNDTRGPAHGPTNAAVRPDRDDRHGRIWRVQHRDAPAIARGLDSPNRWARMNEQLARVGGRTTPGEDELDRLWASGVEARVHVLWMLHSIGTLTPERLLAALEDPSPGVRRAAAEVAGACDRAVCTERVADVLRAQLSDADQRVRIATVRAIASLSERGVRAMTDDDALVLVAMYPWLEENWTRSVLLRATETDLPLFLETALRTGDDALADFTRELCRRFGRNADDIRVALGLFTSIDDATDATLCAGLAGLAATLPDELRVATDDKTVAAFEELLNGRSTDVAIATLPFAARAEPAERLGPAVDALATRLARSVENPNADLPERERALSSLLALPTWRARAIAASARFLDPYFPLETQLRTIDELGALDNDAVASVLLAAFPNISHEARERAFAKLVARTPWTALLLDRIEAGEIAPTGLGPHRSFRLRNHPDAATAARATAILDELTGGAKRAGDELVAALLPTIVEPGDAANGKVLFAKNCAVCHDFDRLDERGRNVGPALTGMGAHGREHLLPFIVDPNRSVEAAYLEYVAETTSGKLVAGVLSYDGPASITLSSSDGDFEVRRDEIESFYSTGRSPMPTGFEDLGDESVRDILAFLCDGFEDYRVLDMSLLFTSTTNALYDRTRDANPMRFTRTGIIDVRGVPMELVDPARSSSGNNALVLKGGAIDDWDSKVRMPQEISVPIGYPLQRMHVLGGIAAWGHPFFGERKPIVKWTWEYADGSEEEVVLHDGVEFADWIGRREVRGSHYIDDLVADGSYGQVRVFHVDPSRTDVAVASITLASYDNRMAPTFFGLTAQVSGVDPDAEVEAAPPLTHPRVLILGGGSSHDFARWYDEELRSHLGEIDGLAADEIEYTEWPEDVLPRLDTLDVLVISNNQPIPDPELRAAIFAHVERGGGLVILHPGAWYNWADWPEYNAQLVGGGARSHESYGTFDVRIDQTAHRLAAGVERGFAVDDELYRFEPHPGAKIDVVATGVSRTGGATYPVAWTVDDKTVCITLGHDGAAHQHPAFRKLVRNAIEWTTPER